MATRKPLAEGVKPASVQRAFSTGVPVGLDGLDFLQINVGLYPVRQGEKETKRSNVCPACDTVTKLEQQYVCPTHKLGDSVSAILLGTAGRKTVDRDELKKAWTSTHGPFTNGTAAKATEINRQLVKVTAEDIAEVNEVPLPAEEGLTLRWCPAEEFEAATLSCGVTYRLRPEGAGAKNYAVIRDLVSNSKIAFYGPMTVRGFQKLWRASVWNGQIVVIEHSPTDDLWPVDEIDAVVSGKVLSAASKVVDKLVGTFDPDEWKNGLKARAVEMKNRKLAELNGSPVPKPTPKPKPKLDSGDDALLALLEASLADS